MDRRLVLALLVACAPDALPPEGHIVVVLSTDAPLPSSDAKAPPPIFDAVRVDVLDGRGVTCASCSREIALRAEGGESTFTIVGPAARTLRARLFRSAFGDAALEPPLVVERVVVLPERPVEGASRVYVDLPARDVGKPASPVAASLEAPARGAAAAPARKAEDGEACLPETLFWMGDRRLPPDGERTANAPRLVRLSPFCVDLHETTVRELRATGRASESEVVRGSGGASTSDVAAFCTYSNAPGANDERPVGCVSFLAAETACEARGRSLPSEAQLELLASSFGRSSFVWGHELPVCGDAVFGHAAGILGGDGTCGRPPRVFLPVPAAEIAGTRDVLVVGDRRVVGLAGNLTEWTREAFAPYGDASCPRSPDGILVDPECRVRDDTTRIAVRGGSFTSSAVETAAALRAAVGRERLRADLGFRCVRP